MIRDFADKETQFLFEEEHSRRFASIERVALRKLIQLNQAVRLSDLGVPPGNRLKALSGRRPGLHAIRINDQWRIVFKWTESGPDQVEITDYH